MYTSAYICECLLFILWNDVNCQIFPDMVQVWVYERFCIDFLIWQAVQLQVVKLGVMQRAAAKFLPRATNWSGPAVPTAGMRCRGTGNTAWFCFPTIWQVWKVLQKWSTSAFISGQKKCFRMQTFKRHHRFKWHLDDHSTNVHVLVSMEIICCFTWLALT